MLKLNHKLIINPKATREALMSVAAALYTTINRNTAPDEAESIATLCKGMWAICDTLSSDFKGGDK